MTTTCAGCGEHKLELQHIDSVDGPYTAWVCRTCGPMRRADTGAASEAPGPGHADTRGPQPASEAPALGLQPSTVYALKKKRQAEARKRMNAAVTQSYRLK